MAPHIIQFTHVLVPIRVDELAPLRQVLIELSLEHPPAFRYVLALNFLQSGPGFPFEHVSV